MAFKDDVVALEREFLEAYQRGDATAACAVYTDDAHYLVPGMAPIHGRPAIEAVTARDIAGGSQITRLTAFHTEAAGDLGYALETFSSSLGDGMTMLALRRENGAWRISAEAILPG